MSDDFNVKIPDATQQGRSIAVGKGPSGELILTTFREDGRTCTVLLEGDAKKIFLQRVNTTGE